MRKQGCNSRPGKVAARIVKERFHQQPHTKEDKGAGGPSPAIEHHQSPT